VARLFGLLPPNFFLKKRKKYGEMHALGFLPPGPPANMPNAMRPKPIPSLDPILVSSFVNATKQIGGNAM